MTTIAYNHKDKEIAYDSRQCMGNFIATDNASKIMITDHGVFFLSGSVPDCEFLANNYPQIARDNSTAYGLAVFDGAVYWISNDNGITAAVECEYEFTAGSGEAYAQAALDFGKSAKEAVEYAMTRDCKTGGEVHVFKVE